jgi:hypothetical protein
MDAVADYADAVLGGRPSFGMASERAVTARPVTPELCAHCGAPIEAVTRLGSWGPADLESKRFQILSTMPIWSNCVTLDRPPSESK